jgi:hypothetical protein
MILTMRIKVDEPFVHSGNIPISRLFYMKTDSSELLHCEYLRDGRAGLFHGKQLIGFGWPSGPVWVDSETDLYPRWYNDTFA